jgi:SAM-dependent methyltransferase
LPQPLLDSTDSPEGSIRKFHRTLRREVLEGNPFLSPEEQSLLRDHHPLLDDPGHYPIDLVESIYLNRRAAPAKAIRENPGSVVLDAGCGCGTDSILFAALGARVVAVNLSAEELGVAERRVRFYEKTWGRRLNITLVRSDLNHYAPDEELSLAWLASILAVIEDQEALLERIFRSTRRRGKIMVVDYNLWHPPFIWGEWRRRRSAGSRSPEFLRQANYWGMVRRAERSGARFFPLTEGGLFADAQFFTPGTLRSLLRRVGFRVLPPRYSGCTPLSSAPASASLENVLSRLLGWKVLGRAYLMAGVKE